MQGYRAPVFGTLPIVIRNLLIANIVVFLADMALTRMSAFNMTDWFALHNFQSEKFSPIQLVTYMFMHGGLSHIFFNMFALVMFGRILEQVWGGKRFLIYYLVTGVGAALCQLVVSYFSLASLQAEVTAYINTPDPELLMRLIRTHLSNPSAWVNDFLINYSADPNNIDNIVQGELIARGLLHLYVDTPTVGASGAIFGVLLAFGVLFPNVQLMLLFPPIPIRAKWFVIGYGVIELLAVIVPQANDNVAHFAHLGGMIFGYILIRYWNRHADINNNWDGY